MINEFFKSDYFYSSLQGGPTGFYTLNGSMLFDRCHTKNRKRSFKQHIKYLNLQSKIQLNHPVKYIATSVLNQNPAWFSVPAKLAGQVPKWSRGGRKGDRRTMTNLSCAWRISNDPIFGILAAAVDTHFAATTAICDTGVLG